MNRVSKRRELCHILHTRYIAPGTFASIGEPTSLDMSNNLLSPAKPISDYQTAFSLSQLARELANGTPGQCEALANGTPGQCEALARGAVSARYEVR